ncbi:MAG TPA: response regulator [Chloroflexota bacterium]|nr:response regulator [Chloroflexota bacterium]
MSVTSAGTTRQRQVLVVDDEDAICTTLATILEDEGYHVVTAVNGEALKVAADSPPDVILLDMMMPLMDGPEVYRRLHLDPRTAAIPVVIMTAAGNAESWARKLGATAAVQKPFSLDTLISTVAWAIERGP